MRAAAITLVAIAVIAGCARPHVAPTTRVGDPPYDPPPPTSSAFGKLEQRDLASASIHLSTTPQRVAFTVPNGTLVVAYYLTLVSGASQDLRGDADGCVRQVDGPIVAVGQVVGKDCANMTTGPHGLTLSQTAGDITMIVKVNATVKV